MFKKTHYLICLLLSISLSPNFAQAPTAFKYQGLARDASGAVYASQIIQLQFLILEDNNNQDATVVYEEQHTLMTSPEGVFSASIGEGLPLKGQFADIDWSAFHYALQIKFRSGTEGNFIDLGNSPLLSVPYALHANTASLVDDADADPTNELQQLVLNGQDLSLSPGGGTVRLDPSGDSPWRYSTSEDPMGIYYLGKVGINNSEPRAALSIGDNFNDSLWAVPAITIGGSGAAGAAIELGNDQKKLRIYNAENSGHQIETKDNGELGSGILNILARQVNISSRPTSRAQNYPLAIQANVNEAHGLLLESGFNNHLWEFYPNSATNQLFLLYNGEAIGFWNPNTGIYTAGVSDQKRKEQIQPLIPVAHRYPELSVYQYYYRNQTGKPYYGLLAQELKEVFPELVSAVRLDGREEVLLVDYDQLTALNTAATREQQAYLQLLETKVSQLEKKLAEQEKRLEKLEALLKN